MNAFPYWHPAALQESLESEGNCSLCSKEGVVPEVFVGRLDEGPVCLGCLEAGKLNTGIGTEASRRPKGDSFKPTRAQIDLLNRHPGIFANDQNQWPGCCSDFMVYLGYPSMAHLGADFFNRRSPKGDGKAVFVSAFGFGGDLPRGAKDLAMLLDSARKSAEGYWSPDDQWESTIFEVHVFECSKCRALRIIYEPD